MGILELGCGLALLTAVAHSVLSERRFLGPLRREAGDRGVLSSRVAKRLVVAMFHLPSLCWAGMAIGMLLLEPEGAGPRATLAVFALLFALSGLGSLWALSRLHPGGVLLLSTSACIVGALLV